MKALSTYRLKLRSIWFLFITALLLPVSQLLHAQDGSPVPYKGKVNFAKHNPDKK